MILNDLKYLNEYETKKDVKWSLNIETNPSYSCSIGSKDIEPDWFKDLLKKLKVEENGYLSKKN